MRRTRIHKINEIRHGTYIKVLPCDVKNQGMVLYSVQDTEIILWE